VNVVPDRSAGLLPSIIDTRRDQMFPTLEPADLERVRRFGIVRFHGAGEALARVGEVGLIIILAGDVDITQHDQSGRRTLIVTYGPGAFMGELAQLAGRPALVDAYAQGPVEALIVPPDRLWALLIAEAELGERIMRALILRRVGLLETGAGTNDKEAVEKAMQVVNGFDAEIWDQRRFVARLPGSPPKT